VGNTISRYTNRKLVGVKIGFKIVFLASIKKALGTYKAEPER
jgi:hypothetical protein